MYMVNQTECGHRDPLDVVSNLINMRSAYIRRWHTADDTGLREAYSAVRRGRVPVGVEPLAMSKVSSGLRRNITRSSNDKMEMRIHVRHCASEMDAHE